MPPNTSFNGTPSSPINPLIPTLAMSETLVIRSAKPDDSPAYEAFTNSLCNLSVFSYAAGLRPLLYALRVCRRGILRFALNSYEKPR